MVAVRHTGLSSRVLPLPMLIDRIRNFHQPGSILDEFHQVSGGKEFNTIGWRISQGLKQTGTDKDRNIVRLTVQDPSRLLRCESRGKLAMEHQEAVLIFSHNTAPLTCPRPAIDHQPRPCSCSQSRATGRDDVLET